MGGSVLQKEVASCFYKGTSPLFYAGPLGQVKGAPTRPSAPIDTSTHKEMNSYKLSSRPIQMYPL